MTENNCPSWHDEIGNPNDHRAGLKRAFQWVDDNSHLSLVDQRRVRKIHHILFDDVVPDPCYAGNFRQRSVRAEFRCLNMLVGVGNKPGSNAEDVVQHMEDLIQNYRTLSVQFEMRFNSLDAKERVLQFATITALIVGEFVRIHPFVNGNGRASRMIWFWCCRRMGLPPQVRISPRPDQATPYAACMSKAMDGDYGPLAFEIIKLMASVNARPTITN